MMHNIEILRALRKGPAWYLGLNFAKRHSGFGLFISTLYLCGIMRPKGLPW